MPSARAPRAAAPPTRPNAEPTQAGSCTIPRRRETRATHLVEVLPQVVGAEDLGDLDELVVVRQAVEERVASEDLRGPRASVRSGGLLQRDGESMQRHAPPAPRVQAQLTIEPNVAPRDQTAASAKSAAAARAREEEVHTHCRASSRSLQHEMRARVSLSPT